VIYPSGPLYDALNRFVGPIIQHGRNPWPYYDTAHKYTADQNIAVLAPPLGRGVLRTTLAAPLGASDTQLTVGDASFNASVQGQAVLIDSEEILLGGNSDGTHINVWQRGYRGTTPASHPSGATVNQYLYWDFWNYNAGPGTITVTQGSSSATGTGTAFKTGGRFALCNSAGEPLPGISIVVWHPTDVEGATGHLWYSVASCASDTALTLGGTYGGNNGMTIPGGTVAYSIATDAEIYWMDYQGDPRTQYYDPMLAYLFLYLRSGIDTYLAAWRQAADLWWVGQWDYGYRAGLYAPQSGGPPARSADYLSMWLRSLDDPPADMTKGLHRVSAAAAFWPFSVLFTEIGDLREASYMLESLVLTAALDSDPATYDFSSPYTYFTGGSEPMTYKDAAKLLLTRAVSPAGVWNTGQVKTPGPSYGSWPNSALGSGMMLSSALDSTTATVADGSTSVVINGGSMVCSNGHFNSAHQGWIWFWSSMDPHSFPALNSQGDVGVYLATCVDATHLTLTTPYSGAGCAGTCGYELSNADIGDLGWGVSGFMAGIANWTMHRLADVLAAAGDSTNAQTARTLALNGNAWFNSSAYRPDTHGINYQTDFKDCGNPVPAADSHCSVADSVSESLAFSAEALISWLAEYQYNQSPTAKQEADSMFNQMWAKPGTCPGGGPCDDSVTRNCYSPGSCWMNDFEPGGAKVVPPYPKWLGQFFGFGQYSAWPAVRIGGLSSSSRRTVYVTMNLAGVSGASSAEVTLTDTTGASIQTVCTSSPCAVVAPRADQSQYAITIQYKSAAGKILASSNLPVAATQ
jgi:hypothetical protein